MSCARWIALIALFSVPPAQAFADFPFEHDVSLGALAENTAWFEGDNWHQQLETAFRFSPAAPSSFSWSGVTGLRYALSGRPRFPLELFARFELLARFGAHYEPACGFELGASALTRPPKSPAGFPDGVAELQADRTTLLYVSAVASPVRLVFGSLRVSIAELHLGSAVGGASAINRIGYLTLEYRL